MVRMRHGSARVAWVRAVMLKALMTNKMSVLADIMPHPVDFHLNRKVGRVGLPHPGAPELHVYKEIHRLKKRELPQ